jgi:hypothetical protein
MLSRNNFIRALLTFAFLTGTARATVIGEILVCYACQNTGNSTIDAALAANPGVASDGLLFAIVNTSSFSITGGIFSVSNASPDDSFTLPTIAADSTYILMPGITSDGLTHPSGGLFGDTGVMDTSDGAGGLSDSSIFRLTASDNGLAVTSVTFGSSTGTPDTFTPGDPGLFLTYRDPGATGMTSFIGMGPDGDGGCNNCYFGEVATLNVPSSTGAPEPGVAALMFGGVAALLTLRHRSRRIRQN